MNIQMSICVTLVCGKNIHLDGSSVGHNTALDIETLRAVTVGVNAVAATGWGGRGSRSSTVLVVPGTGEGSRGVGVRSVGAGPRKGIVDGGGEIESTVGASRALFTERQSIPTR